MIRFLCNDPSFKDRRRGLRKSSTEAEKILWGSLRGKCLHGLKFWRQYSFGPYILDFYCPSKRLALELDGEHHTNSEIQDYDSERTLFLEANDIRILRFWNNEIFDNLEGVLSKILSVVSHGSPS